MGFSNFNVVRALKDSGGYDWLIKARILSIWRAINIENGEIRGINILVIDDSNTRIVCFAGKKDYSAIEKALFCGRIYRISNFSVKKYHDDPYPHPVRNEYRIFFSNYTYFEKDCSNETLIPYVGFDLHHLADVEKLSAQTLYLSDTVGVVEVVKPSYSFVNKKKVVQTFVPFFISNGSFSAKVIFWDNFGDMLQEEMEKVKTKPAIISIMCCKAQNRGGDVYFSSNPATKFYINCDHYSVRLLRKKINEGVIAVDSNTNVDYVEPQVHKIKELAFAPPNLREVVVHASLTCIMNDHTWYDRVCTTCSEVLFPDGRRFRCSLCDRFVRFPDKRFRLQCMAADDSGEVKVVLLDREVRRLIGKSVFDIEVDLAVETEGLNLQTNGIPPILNGVLHKPLDITLIIPVIVDVLAGLVYNCLSLEVIPIPIPVLSSNMSTATAANAVEIDEANPSSTACTTPLTAHSSSKHREIFPSNSSALTPQFYSYTNDHHIKLINLLCLNTLRVSDLKPQLLLKCFAQIVGVDQGQKWYADTCAVCGLEAHKRLSDLYCSTCSRQVFYPLRRCSLSVEVSDILSSSTFSLGHDVLCRLAPREMEVFVDRKTCLTSKLPNCFLNFIGLKCLFVLEMDLELFTEGVHPWNCVDVEILSRGSKLA